MGKRKTIEDYQIVAESSGGAYVLDGVPSTTHQKTDGWICKQGHKWQATYKNIAKGRWCPKCSGNIRVTLDDYIQLALDRGGKYILSGIPRNTNICIRGWQCSACNYTYSTSYGGAKRKNREGWCPRCSCGRAVAYIEDYQDVAKSKEGSYILDNIPEKTITPVLGWKCKEGHVWKACYNNVNNGTWCPTCYKTSRYGYSEQLCREIFEKLTNARFPTKRPKWLGGLELDGYSVKMKLAFEYNGRQHYLFNSHFHKSIAEFTEQQRRDRRKADLCELHGVALVTIPYTLSYLRPRELEDYITLQLYERGYIGPRLVFYD